MASASTHLSDVLVVVPCLNEEANLPRILDELTRDSGKATIVVADGGSRDASRRIIEEVAARHPNVHLLDNPKRLQSAGVNLAVKTFGDAKRWLVRVDAHCRYPANYVAGLIDVARAQDANAVVVPMRSIGIGCFQRASAGAQNSRLGTGGSLHRHVGTGAFVDHGHHALFEIERFRTLGGYDEGFSHNEDAELDHRQTESGARIWLEPALALDYFPRATPTSLFRQYYNYGRGRAKTLMRHRMRMKLRQALPLAVIPAVMLLPAALWSSLALLPAMVWLGICLSFGAALGIRARDRCATISGVAAAIMHLGWAVGFLRQRFLAN